MKATWQTWPDRKLKTFIADWRDGLAADAMREKYGKRYQQIAIQLRAAGYELPSRKGLLGYALGERARRLYFPVQRAQRKRGAA